VASGEGGGLNKLVQGWPLVRGVVFWCRSDLGGGLALLRRGEGVASGAKKRT
jgi:hypothetical protein